MVLWLSRVAQTIGVALGEQHVYVSGRAGPLLSSPSDVGSKVYVHAIVDHGIVTAIFNNRTAITRMVAPKSAASAGIELFGVDGVTVKCEWNAWALRDAIITDA